MINFGTSLNKIISKSLLLIIFLNTIIGLNLTSPIRVYGQNRPIVITADQPNVWTLEQAHYLLAQLHRRNLDLKARKLTDLDANALNGTRLDILKTFLEINASYNQGAGFDNKLAARNKELNAQRQPKLIKQRDDLNEINISLTREIAVLDSRLSRAEGDEKKKITAELDEKKAERAVIREQMTQIDNELKTMNAASSTFTSTAPTGSFDPAKIPTGALDSIMKKALEDSADGLTDPPQLNASLQLDNYLQMQYEILAKQLSLLRDEVGPGERLLFLEIPQSVKTTRGKADKKWAQTWFKIAGYTCLPSEELPCPDGSKGEEDKSNSEKAQQQYQAPETNQQKMLAITLPGKTESKNKYFDLGVLNIAGYKPTNRLTGSASNRQVRVVDLIPRQSSLNVNDVKLRTNASGFGFLASFLFGFGSSLKYQRQREQFSQFVQQELYSSGFGKGAREFGWTFTPMPGTSRLTPGTRTTYAIVVVPKNASSLVLESSGCYFPRSEYQPINFINTQNGDAWKERTENDEEKTMCTTQESMVVVIPSNADPSKRNFTVKTLEYKSVQPSERVMVTVRGNSFPTQVGVMVGGTSLVQSIGLAQPLIEDDSTVRESISNVYDFNSNGIYGEFERLSDEEITFWFKMPKDYVGTPPISIVAPGQAKLLNNDISIRLIVNGDSSNLNKVDDLATPDIDETKFYDLKLDKAAYMFGNKLSDPKNESEIYGVDVYRKDDDNVTVVIRGKELNVLDKILINGKPFDKQITPLYWIQDYPIKSKDEYVQVTVVTKGNVLQPPKVRNPLYKSDSETKPPPAPGGDAFNVTDKSTERYTPAGENTPEKLTIKLVGKGFNNSVTSSVGKFTFANENLSFLELENPAPATKVKLTDEKNRLFIEFLIIRSEFISSSDNQ